MLMRSTFSYHNFSKESSLYKKLTPENRKRIKSLTLCGFDDSVLPVDLIYIVERDRARCEDLNLMQVFAKKKSLVFVITSELS